MTNNVKYKSIRWKVVAYYLLLVFFVISFIGFFILREIRLLPEFSQGPNMPEELILEIKEVIIIGTIIALFITGIIAYIFASAISKKMDNLSSQLEKILDGDYETKLEPKGQDELDNISQIVDLLRQDIGKKISEKNLTKKKFDMILEQIGDGLIVFDDEGKVQHFNESVCKMLNLNQEEIVKISIEDLSRIIGSLKATDQEEILIEYGNNAYYLRQGNYKAQGDINGGRFFIFHDITGHKKMKEIQAGFVANVSHELKTPLTTIKSYAETLLENNMIEDETSKEFLNIINSEADRMNRLVRDLIQLSRSDYEDLNWLRKKANIVRLLRHVEMKMSMTAKSKNLHLNSLYDKDAVINVEMDRDKIEQVLQNIISNSIKYTDEGGRIDVDIAEEGPDLKIEISDSGIGIPRESLQHVFERFYRVDKARTREMGGSGLGLSISKQIIEEHNGSISIDSTKGKGTKVTILLPRISFRGKHGIE